MPPKLSKPRPGDTSLFDQPVAEEQVEFEGPPRNRCQPQPFGIPQKGKGKDYHYYEFTTTLGTVYPHSSSPDDAMGMMRSSRFRKKGPTWSGTSIRKTEELKPNDLVLLRNGNSVVVECKARDADAAIRKNKRARERRAEARKPAKTRRKAA